MKKTLFFPLLCMIIIFLPALILLEPADATSISHNVLHDNTCSPSIAISVTPLEDIASYAVIETIPYGLLPLNINENGQWHEDEQEIRWGNFRDHSAKSLSYDLTGANGTYELSQLVFSADGILETYEETTSISFQCTQTQYPEKPDLPEPETPLEPMPSPLFYVSSETVPTSLRITSSINPSYIYYTTDGSRPTSASQLFTEKIDIEQSTLIRAINIKSGMANSPVSEIRLSHPIMTPNFDVIQYVYNNDTCAPSIAIHVTPTFQADAYSLEISLPYGLTPYNIIENGQWISDTDMIRWGNFMGHMARSFSCELTGSNGMYELDQIIYSENGVKYEVKQTTIVIMNCPLSSEEIPDEPPDEPEPEIIEDPIIDISSDSLPFVLSLTCQTPGTTIYYTTDGSRPSENALIYSEPVEIFHPTKIRAIAIKGDLSSSKTVQYEPSFSPILPYFGNVHTIIEDNETCFPKVNLSITPEANIQSYAVEIFLPENLTPILINNNGLKCDSQNSIRWGNFRDSSIRDLSFRVKGENQETTILGKIGFDGHIQEIPNIPITVKCDDNNITPQLSIHSLDYTISARSSFLTITVTDLNNSGRMYWQVIPEADWITVANNENGTGDGICTIQCTRNIKENERLGKVKIQSNEATNSSQYVEIFQRPNQPPVAEDNTLTLDEDKHLYILLKSTDFENDPLSYTFVEYPSKGQVIIEGDIAIYTPKKDYHGMDRFSFKTNDGVLDSNTANVLLTIYPIDDPPVAENISFQTTENSFYPLTFSKTDIDNEQLTVNIQTPPEHGSIPQELIYYPDEWFWGTDSFIYSLTDGHTSVTATVTITVNRANEYTLALAKATDVGEIEINGQLVWLPWEGSFSADSQVTLNAISTNDLIFKKWTEGSLVHTENQITVLMNIGKKLSVHFVPPLQTLKLYGYQSVNVNGEPYSLPIEKNFYKGEQVSLNAVPDDLFIGWSGDITGNQNPIDFVIESDMTIGALFYDPKEWSMTLLAETIDLTPVHTDDITIGVSLFSSTQPHQLPNEYGCSLWVYSSDWQKNSQFIQAYQSTEYSWIIALNPHGNMGSPDPRTTVIHWDPEKFSQTGCYRMYSGHDYTGDILVSDMRQVNNYPVTGGESVQTFTIVWSKQFTETVTLNTKLGWNLISLPVKPLNSDPKILFPDSIVYEFKSGTYIGVDQMQIGKGYWLKASKESYEITGEAFHSYSVKLSKGWHLIGALQHKVTFNNNCVEAIYEYKEGSYSEVSELLPGKGYWVKVENLCTFSP